MIDGAGILEKYYWSEWGVIDSTTGLSLSEYEFIVL
jgi:hypothetical protein